MDPQQHSITAAHDRVLEVLTAGPIDGVPLVFHTGSPFGAALFPPLTQAASEHGLRVVHYSRPGFGRSTAQPGRSVADTAGDVAAILDGLGADRFVTIGWSGGGPHALAAAALLRDRCAAVAVVSGIASYGAPGLDWFAGMSDENREEFSLATAGTSAFLRHIEAQVPSLEAMQAQPLDADTLARPDAADIAAFREFTAAGMRQAVLAGVAGWHDDDLAFVRPWGFEPAQVRSPATVWHGEADQLVPVAHGRWLVDQISGASAHFVPALGHGVVLRTHYRAIVAELVALAAVPLQRGSPPQRA